MPEREYFSLRYAIPGYTFILLLIAINYVPLIEILDRTGVESAFGAFLAFLSLFTGSALGFLISQFHWRDFDRKRFFRAWKLESLGKQLIKGCDLPTDISDEKLEVVVDYILQRQDSKYIHEYIQRRWDMYHVLSAIKWALFLGALTGIAFRIYYQFFLYWSQSFTQRAIFAETFALMFIVACAVVLFIIVHLAVGRSVNVYGAIIEALIRKSAENVSKEEIKKVFPTFFNKEGDPVEFKKYTSASIV